MSTFKPFEVIVPKDNFRQNINNIHVDETNIVATDTRLLLIKPHGWNIPKPFTIVNQKVKKNIIPFTGTWENRKINDNLQCFNYKYIIPLESNVESLKVPKEETLKTALYRLSIYYSVVIDYLDHATKLNKLNRLLGEIVYVGYTDQLVVIKSSSGYTLYLIRYTLT